MGYQNLQEFITRLEQAGELVRIKEPVSPYLTITEITDRVSKAGGPALLFENVPGYDMPVLMNAFGSMRRMCLALEVESLDDIATDLLSFIFPRANGRKPVDDFCKMFNLLGNAWWEEVRRTKKRYLATRLILGKAKSNEGDINSVRPLEVREPTRMARSMTFLKLKHKDLHSSNLQEIIKRAFGRQAKKQHPDQGGNPDLFRKLRDAYEQLIRWGHDLCGH